MDEDGTAGRDMGSDQPRPDSSEWSRQHDTTPLEWPSGPAESQTQPSNAYESPWSRPAGQAGQTGYSVPQYGAAPQFGAPQYGAPQYGAPGYGTPPPYGAPPQYGAVPPYGTVPPTGAPLGWPGSPYAAPPADAPRPGLTGAKLAIAGLALVVASAASSALIVNAIKSDGSGAVA